jgi:hypothetical protein
MGFLAEMGCGEHFRPLFLFGGGIQEIRKIGIFFDEFWEHRYGLYDTRAWIWIPNASKKSLRNDLLW